jgi:hypothetical protein
MPLTPWFAALFAAAAAAAPTDRPPAPHAGCADARAVSEARHLDARTVLLKTTGAGYRIALAEACPTGASGDLVALAPHGWLCGGAEEYVRVGRQVCAVAAVAPLDERGWALALRAQAGGAGDTALAGVTVEARVARQRRFAASAEYCVDPRRVRGWNVVGRDLLVTTAPRRGSAEAPSYRLELGRACPEADLGSGLQLVSGVGIGWICGHAGDTARISSASAEAEGGILQPSAFSTSAALAGCPIVAVYPLR